MTMWTVIDGVLLEEYYSDDLSVIDIRLAARLYPLGDSRPIRPYLGAGVGYFWFLDSWEDQYYETFEDPFDPGTFITYASGDKDTETVADGFFPFLLGGVTVPIGSDFEFLFEVPVRFREGRLRLRSGPVRSTWPGSLPLLTAFDKLAAPTREPAIRPRASSPSAYEPSVCNNVTARSPSLCTLYSLPRNRRPTDIDMIDGPKPAVGTRAFLPIDRAMKATEKT